MKNIKLYDLLEHLEKRKAMYLGNNYNFQSLDSFLCGYSCAADYEHLESDGYNNFSKFNIWLLGHLPEHFGASGGWHWQLKNRNPHNELKAFEEFFYFLEIFKQAKNDISFIKIEPTPYSQSLLNLKAKVDTIQSENIEKLKVTRLEKSTTIWMESVSESDSESFYNSWFLTENEFEEELKNRFRFAE